MTSYHEFRRTADRLKDALDAAAGVMAECDSHVLIAERKVRRAGRWLPPLTAAASVLAIAAATALAGHLARNHAAPGTSSAPARPEFYMTTSWIASRLVLDVRRTADGKVTGSASFSGLLRQEEGFLTADASDRKFFFALVPCAAGAAFSRFYRITITDLGRISGTAAVGTRIRGLVTDLAVAPDGSRMAYRVGPSRRCDGYMPFPAGQISVHIMDLSSGAIHTWHATTAAAVTPASTFGPRAKNSAPVVRVRNTVGRLSWAADGRSLIVNEYGAILRRGRQYLAVLALDPASGGGSLPAHSRLLWYQGNGCGTCEALAGPGDSLTAFEMQSAGTKLTRLLVIRIPLTGGRAQTVLYSELSATPVGVDWAGIFADPSGRWVIAWPLADTYGPRGRQDLAGWISGGRLHPLAGTTPLFRNDIAW